MRTLPGKKGFTLIELLVAITVLVILLAILFSITNTVAKTVINTSVKIDAFASGRAAFDLMNQKLSQATLNTYWDYDNSVVPSNYYRQSDLQFLVRQNVQKSGYGQEVYFVTPSTYSTDPTIRSTDGLLNACGFFVAYGPDDSFKPGTIPVATTRYRYRLMQGLEPTENLAAYGTWPTPASPPAVPTSPPIAAGALLAAQQTYENTTLPAYATTLNTFWTGSSSNLTTSWTSGNGGWPAFWATHAWITNTIGNLGTGVPNANDTPLANNVIALIVWPHLSAIDDPTGNKLATAYTYDSQYEAMSIDPTTKVQPLWANQLPPTIQVTMIVINEASAARIDTHSSTPPAAIETALNGKFVVSTYTQYQADLAAVTTSLAANHIAFEILNTSVTMKESKWSDNSQ